MTGQPPASIRPATVDDAAAIWAILKPVFRAGETYAIEAGISRAQALAYWTAHRAFVAETRADVVGTYYLRPNQPGGGAHVCNAGFATAPAAEGKGVARAMLTHSLAAARDAGYTAMQFNFVLACNTRAIDTWERAGFSVIGRQPKAFVHPRLGHVDALIMHKSLE